MTSSIVMMVQWRWVNILQNISVGCPGRFLTWTSRDPPPLPQQTTSRVWYLWLTHGLPDLLPLPVEIFGAAFKRCFCCDFWGRAPSAVSQVGQTSRRLAFFHFSTSFDALICVVVGELAVIVVKPCRAILSKWGVLFPLSTPPPPRIIGAPLLLQNRVRRHSDTGVSTDRIVSAFRSACCPLQAQQRMINQRRCPPPLCY